MNLPERNRYMSAAHAGHYIQSFVAQQPRFVVFDSFLYASHMSEINVSKVCRESGYIWLSRDSLTPSHLNQYCEYPFSDPFTHKPIDTFMGWNARSIKSGNGPVMGTVRMAVLVTSRNAISCLTIKSTWSAINEKDKHVIRSQGGLESELVEKMESALM